MSCAKLESTPLKLPDILSLLCLPFQIPFSQGSTPTMSMKQKMLCSKVENVKESEEMSLLDLPELVLESILGRLPLEGLCKMAAVCSSLRDRCWSDHLWERHMKEKWGRVIGPAAYREWKCHIASRTDLGVLDRSEQKVDSIMSFYHSLQSGKFCFPAQVFDRQDGLSCYNAELSYDCRTDTFRARYPPYWGQHIRVEDGVQWYRLRAPPVETLPNELHVSDCLNELHPGDNFEVQWRMSRELLYGWWYGVVGHLETCDGNENHCHCHFSDTVIIEFTQYTLGSWWRRASLNRKDHGEQGNAAYGFYGGIRKLYSEEEISMWKPSQPTEVLELLHLD